MTVHHNQYGNRNGLSPTAEATDHFAGLEDLLGEWTEEELRLWAAFHQEHETAVIDRGERGASAP